MFHDVAYKARNREDLLAGVDEFLDKVSGQKRRKRNERQSAFRDDRNTGRFVCVV